MSEAKRLPSMVAALEYIKECGVPIEYIVDVGILTSTYPLMHCFPTLKHLLVEPVRSFYPGIEEIYKKHNIDHTLMKCAAGARDSTLVLCEYAKDGGHKITHSKIFNSPSEAITTNLLACLDIEVRTVESLLREAAEQGLVKADAPFLLKLDVDGTEEDIIEGAKGVLDRCSVVVLEVPIVKLLGRVQLLDSLGFTCVDIVDPCYYKRAMSQVDCIFVRKDLHRKHGVDPWSKGGPVEFSQWYEGAYVVRP
jgi:FkbM family methyltransferase